MNWPWEELGLSGPAPLPVIRRAYAERLKTMRPEENPEGFQRLHAAYTAASRMARQGGGDSAENSAARPAPSQETDSDVQSDSESGNEDESEVSRNWDFERLFAEGEAEERGRRFQRVRELRRANQSRYETWKPTPSRDPADVALSWMAVSRALSLVDELAMSGAELSMWSAFCRSELFLYVRDNPDFVFALEDLLQEYPAFPAEGCRAFFQAYQLFRQPIKKEYGYLYRLLAPEVPRSAAPPDRARKKELLILMLTTLLILAVLTVNLLVDSIVEEDLKKAQVCEWLGQDFGREFVRAENRVWEPWFVLFDAQARIYFRARWDGRRDERTGTRGYVTNYTEARMARAVAGFSDRWHCSVSPYYDEEGGGASDADWSAYYLYFPMTGAGETITALEELLSALRARDWYQELPPDYTLYLCWQDWSFYRYEAREEPFPGKEILYYYEHFFGPDLCRVALEQTGIAAADMGEGAYVLLSEGGSVKLDNRRFFHVIGAEKPPVRTLYHYFLSEDCTELFCLPADIRRSEWTLRNWYRMDRDLYEVQGFPEKLSVFHPVAD